MEQYQQIPQQKSPAPHNEPVALRAATPSYLGICDVIVVVATADDLQELFCFNQLPSLRAYDSFSELD